MRPLPNHPDVIVVGAGTSGLSAAKALADEGFEVAVLEAASHIGGRCVTDVSVFDTPFDRGGSWLHSAAINPLARLAEQRGTRLHKERWEWDWVNAAGAALTRDEVSDYSRYHRSMWAQIRMAVGTGAGDMPVDKVLPGTRWTGTAKHWVAQMHGSDADVTSICDVAQYADAEGDWLVAGGLGAFVKSLFADVAVQLECPVTEINLEGPGVRAVTSKGTIEAKWLILTVSTGVLGAEAIKFVPALPDAKLSAIEDLPNGLLNKVGLEFDPKWQGAHQGQMADYHPGGGEFCTLHFGFCDTSLAVGFVAGRFADLLEVEGPGAATEFCLQGLRATFGNDVIKSVRRTTETAWRSDPNTIGSYSFARPGGADARRALSRPVDDRLFFAGEATIPNSYATVHGAYQSGIEVARRIVAACRN